MICSATRAGTSCATGTGWYGAPLKHTGALGAPWGAAELGASPHRLERQPQHVGEPVQQRPPLVVAVEQLGAAHRHHERRAVGDERATAVVQHEPAHGRRDDLALAVGGGGCAVAVGSHDLHGEQPGHQRHHEREHEDRPRRAAGRRSFTAAPPHRLALDPAVEHDHERHDDERADHGVADCRPRPPRGRRRGRRRRQRGQRPHDGGRRASGGRGRRTSSSERSPGRWYRPATRPASPYATAPSPSSRGAGGRQVGDQPGREPGGWRPSDCLRAGRARRRRAP